MVNPSFNSIARGHSSLARKTNAPCPMASRVAALVASGVSQSDMGKLWDLWAEWRIEYAGGKPT